MNCAILVVQERSWARTSSRHSASRWRRHAQLQVATARETTTTTLLLAAGPRAPSTRRAGAVKRAKVERLAAVERAALPARRGPPARPEPPARAAPLAAPGRRSLAPVASRTPSAARV